MPFDKWRMLLHTITAGECILFLGPDLPLVLPDGTRRCPTTDLARKIAGALEPGDGAAAVADPNDLARAAQCLLIQEEGNAIKLEMLVSEWHENLSGQRSELHDDLAALPFHHIITSAPDPLMETALREAGKSPCVERYHYRGANDERRANFSAREPLLYYLYGRGSEPDSVVLSNTQLLDFLARLIAKDPPLPKYVDARLTTGRVFLFLGFGLRHWYLRILLHVLKVLRKGTISYAIETLDSQNEKPWKDTILFYRDNFKVGIHQEDVVAFVKTLRGKYVPPPKPAGDGTAADPSTATPVDAGPDGPTVFICHASENKDVAEEVHEALERAGLQPWLDKEDLRGGDRWDAVIESTIEEASYFVVLNSHELLAKTQDPRGAYVNREIKAALDGTRERFTKFIFPVRIDDAPLFEPLRDFQAIDLRTQDVREIVRAIKREAERAP